MEHLVEFSRNHFFYVAALVGLGALLVYTEVRRLIYGKTEIEPGQAVRLINGGAAVLDTRSKEQYSAGHIANAKSEPMESLPDRLDKLKRFQKKPVLVCCESGVSAGRAAGMLRNAGFEHVFTLRGGLTAWRRDNLPLQK